MTDEEHARKYAEESISLAVSMTNPMAETIARMSCLYGLTYKNDKIKQLQKQLEQAKKLLNAFLDFESACMENGITIAKDIREQAEQFLKEIEK